MISGCGGGGGSSTSLTGTVINGATETPLSGVRVAIGSVNTTTGTDGSFILKGLSTGPGVLTAQLAGYEISSQNITIKSGANTLPEPIRMAPTSGDPPDQTPRTLQGTITLSGASNATGVTVSLFAGTTQYDQMITASDGKYQFWAPVANYEIRAAKAGFITKTQQVAIKDLTKVITVNLTLERQ